MTELLRVLFVDSNEDDKKIIALMHRAKKRDVVIIKKRLPVGDLVYLEMSGEPVINHDTGEIRGGTITKHVLVEAKGAHDVVNSIHDNRKVTQHEGIIDYVRESELCRAFLVIYGDVYKASARMLGNYYSHMLGVLDYMADYITKGIHTVYVPPTSRDKDAIELYADMCFKLFDKDVKDVIRHVITIDYSNKKHEEFTRSLAQYDKIGIKTAYPIAQHYEDYDTLLQSNPVDASNVYRAATGKKMSNKPMESIVGLFNKLFKRKIRDGAMETW